MPAVSNLERERVRLRWLDPREAYAELADGRLRLDQLTGPGGVYGAAEVAEHMKEGLAPDALLRPLLHVRGVRAHMRFFADRLQLDLWHRDEVVGGHLLRREPCYSEASTQSLLHLPTSLVYLLAREDLVSIGGLVAALDGERLMQHANEGALRLPGDVLRGSVEPLLRCVRLGLMPALPLQGAPRRWLETAVLAWGRQNLTRGGELDGDQEALLSLLRGIPVPQRLVVAPPLRTFEAVRSGEVCYARVAEHLPPLSLAQMGELAQRGLANWADWFVRWPHDDAVLVEASAFEVLSPFLVSLGGPNAARAADLLVAQGRLPLARAAAALAPTWRQGAMLPAQTTAWVRAETRLPQLLRDVVLPATATAGEPLGLADQRRNAAYLALCIVTFLERARPLPVEPAAPPEAAEPAERNAEGGPPEGRPDLHASALARLDRLLGTDGPTPGRHAAPPSAPSDTAAPVGGVAVSFAAASAEDGGDTLACDACLDEHPAAAFVDLEACAHGPRYDRACFLAYIDRNEVGSHTCPDPDCRRPFGLADAVHLALPFERRLAWAAHAARDALQREVDWVACRTADCLGGRFEPASHNAPLACTCCGVTAQPMRGRPVSYAQLDAAARAYVASLVRDAAVRLPPRTYEVEPNNPDRNRPVRECYHCGTATQHTSACMHMTCRVESGGCGGDWDFVGGRLRQVHYDLGPARYVPHNSWLVDLGLYDGLTPGEHDIDVVPVMRANLARLQRAAAAAGS